VPETVDDRSKPSWDVEAGLDGYRGAVITPQTSELQLPASHRRSLWRCSEETETLLRKQPPWPRTGSAHSGFSDWDTTRVHLHTAGADATALGCEALAAVEAGLGSGRPSDGRLGGRVASSRGSTGSFIQLLNLPHVATRFERVQGRGGGDT
jgi:hypothetical protein